MGLQQQQQQHRHHMRANSEMNMPWSGSVSPSVVLTPSEPSSQPSFLLANPAVFEMSEDFTLAHSVNLSTRHSHTGVAGRGGLGRGRPVDRSAPSSRGSSRGSSPYSWPMPMESSSAGPALGPTGMSISPTQIFGDEMGNHLTVPVASHFEGHHHARRHSFHLGARPEPGLYMDMVFGNGTEGTGDAQSLNLGPLAPVSTPSAPITPSRALAQVASATGISASEPRRTKAAKFACPTCPQTFTTNQNLKNHINAHLGVKKYQCEHCTRAFTTASVLARHCKTCKSAPHHP
ncbi:hypothetical protein BKA70DRAFT_1120711 [Coprinopsis sp. MPI-PUGE-AT-0042]|nr:hypothetical protein BKA70DRAFT_1120711 [Coprinopsis sp. MPI-PUGE-AT-0042]